MIIVSGFRRTGTSAMMHALACSVTGSAVVITKEGNGERQGNVIHNGYIPNPRGLYEVAGNTRKAEFLRKHCDKHHLILKVLFDRLVYLPTSRYKIVFMERDEEEIKASVEQVNKHFKAINFEAAQEFPDFVQTFSVSRPYNREDIDHVLGIMDVRSDVELLRVQYADLVAEPIATFQRVAEFLAPHQLNVGIAASTIDEKYYRMRKDSWQVPTSQKAAHG